MEQQVILLISDMRQVYLAELLTKKGYHVRCLDIRNTGILTEQLKKLGHFLDDARMLILPIPVSKILDQAVLHEILNKDLKKETLVFGGCFQEEQ